MSHRTVTIGIPEQDPNTTTDDHAELQNVTANQHHAKSHTHNGADGSGTVSYDSLADLPSSGVTVHDNDAHTTTGFPAASAPGDTTQQGSSLSVARLDHKHSRENSLGAFGTRDHDLLSGLTDDDHTQYALRSILTALGDLIYAGASAVWTRLAGNTTTTRKFLSQTGDGAASAAPVWDTLVSGDLPASVVETTDVDDVPVNGATTDPISSNWAFDHEAAADPHTGYRLESADHSHQTTGLQAGQLDHGLSLTGLTDDDHTQYRLESVDHTHQSTGAQAGTLALAAFKVDEQSGSSTTAWTTSLTTLITLTSMNVTNGDRVEISVSCICNASTATFINALIAQSTGTATGVWQIPGGQASTIDWNIVKITPIASGSTVFMGRTILHITGTGTLTIVGKAVTGTNNATTSTLQINALVLRGL
jgi:hypothetical protein